MCIKMEITKEEIIKINEKYDGSPLNIHNLEFDLDMANKEKNIYTSNAHIIRGIICGHSFLDGCKSTALEITIKRFYKNNIKCDEKKLSKFFLKIAINNYSIEKIEKGLRKICKKQIKK